MSARSLAAPTPPSLAVYAEQESQGFTVRAYELRRAFVRPELTVAIIPGMEERPDACENLCAALDARLRIFSLELPWSGQQNNRWGLANRPFEWLRLGLELLPAQADVVIAHSFGANALLQYLQYRTGERMRAAVLMSPFYKARHEDFEWSVLTYYVEQFRRLLEEGLAVRQKRPLSPEFVAAMAEKVRDHIGPHGWMQFFDLFSRTPGLQLSSLRMPCLVVGGENDFAALPEDGRALARALPHAKAAILPDCGHFSMVERPEAVAAIINGFLESAIPRSETISAQGGTLR